MLQLEHVKKSYKKNECLKDVTYTFHTNKIYPILGAAGSGRSTLFACIAQDMPVDEGEITVDRKKFKWIYAAKQSVLPMYITAFEFVDYLCELNSGSSKPEYYIEKVKLVEEHWHTLICDLSFESKKRLQLAAFLIQKPYIALFDEPIDYVSEEFSETFLSVLKENKKNSIILVSTGELSVAKKICKDIVMLNQGTLNDISEEMLEMPEIERAIHDVLGDIED